jgi:Spy/CpxP family protein refolding chaperone
VRAVLAMLAMFAMSAAMRRSSAVAGVVALFLVGVAVGALGANLVSWHRPWRGLAALHGAAGHLGGQRMAEELQRRLDLNADQRRQLDAILADTHRETQAIWQEVRPRIREVIERGQNRIATILTPAQRQEFEAYRKEHAARLRLLLGTGPH